MQPGEIILSHLVEDHPENVSVKIFENWSIGLGVNNIYRFYYV